MKKVRVIALGTILACSIGLGTLSVEAGNDKSGYSFTIKKEQANSYTGTEYRQTTTERNTWKVRMYKSTEGTNTLTTYWLEKSNGTNVSPAVKVKAGSGGENSGRNHYIKGNSGANATEVRLTAENNNYSSNSYSVKGYWDEETGRILPSQYNTYYTTEYNK
ncbi:DUF2712 domain-containing protein [Peribacillus simplex]|uniref:DUF2712 domain-containing protein n=2 Tax=Peribacillus TaxID=2675229 RepID=A0AA90SL10_9BACI|nr:MULTISPECIES: DUF2712 domain-containing protein [Peribacillus]MDP1419579.1 DUF2712 domain-containing protein [Peribacillus simplex]MDP1452546.1 DUF2712 domain-containing protein [Peribacillus frigoritolerans]